MWARVCIGTNTILGSEVARTALLVAGNRLLVLDGSGDIGLRLNAELYDERGRRVGVLLSNRWQHEQLDVTLEFTNDHVRLLDRDSTILLDVASVGQVLVVSRLDLWTRDGHYCVVDNAGRLSTSDVRRASTSVVSDRATHAPLHTIDLCTAFTPSTSGRRAY